MSGDFAARIARLPAEQRRLLEERLRARREAAEAIPTAGAERRAGPLPLSSGQERLWFLQQLEPRNPAYHMPGAVELRGRLDARALGACLDALVGRHEALRTRFLARDGSPVQVVGAPRRQALPVVDLGALADGEAVAAAGRLATAAARRPFDLEAGPVLRTLLLRLAPGEHRLVVVLHHIAADGWSLGILVRELADLYPPLAAGGGPAGAPLPIQYGDYAVWQRRWLAGSGVAAHREYWLARLAGLPALELPTDRPRPAVSRFRGARVPLALPAPLQGALARLGARHEATPFMGLLAAFAALLGRSAGQRDFAVGSPVANRARVETEGVIGFFVNTLVLRADLGGDPRPLELLARLRRTVAEALSHQDLPFDRLVEELEPARSLARNPLFQAMLALDRALPGAALPDLALLPSEIDAGTSKLDLFLSLAEGPQGELAGYLEVDADLFDRSTAARLARHFLAALGWLAGEEDRPLSGMGLLGDAERQQATREWNDTAFDLSGGELLHQGFEGRAAAAPEAVAVAAGEECVSYRGLDRRADSLAALLRGRGVGPEAVVGIALERSPTLPAAVLAALKSGGAYLPLDPAFPAERLALMLGDAGARVVLTERAVEGRLSGAAAAPVVLDTPGQGPVPVDRPASPPACGPGNLAYLIYTSGSTGRPKGVAIEHRSAVALLRWAGARFGPRDLAGVLASTSISFDLSVFELFAPLSSGGGVILAGTALELPALPQRDRVTLVNSVPSVLAEVLRLGRLPPSVRVVNLAGEALPAPLAERLLAAPGVDRVHNLYGPSEDTTYSTEATLARGASGPPPIGRPLPGTEVHLLDAAQRPVPIAVTGEIHLGGAGLARGYLGRPALTAERFVPHPFAGGGLRLYRTGDLARRGAGGCLEFLGRRDQQVKLRGFRIELAEIESALARHPAVSEAAVALRQDGPGDPRLVGYVVPAEGAPPAPAELSRFLAGRLPGHMVPAVLRLVPALPRTPSGKLDRRALPALDPGAGAGAAPVPPRTPAEEVLAGLWCELLGLAEVGVHDSFFERGGHSLLATRLASRLRDSFGVELPVRALFEAPTVAALAERVAAARGAPATDPEAPPLAPLPRAAGGEPSFALSFAQERLWILDRLDPGTPAYNIPSALRLAGRLAPAALAASFAALVARHESLRTTFRDGSAGGPRAWVSPPGGRRPPLPVVGVERLAAADREAAVGRLAGRAARQSFDLGRGPLLLHVLLRLGEEDHALLLVVHHIVGDGWSMGVFTREALALYEGFAAGRPAALPELPIQYADFAAWQRRWLLGTVLARQLAYWRERLMGLAPLELPTDRPRPAVKTYAGAQLVALLSPGEAAELAAAGRRRGASLFMTLLAAFQSLLGRYSGQRDFALGTYSANRNRSEVEGLIGFFVNNLVLRVDLSGDPTFGELLARVREASLGAAAHQDVPFERLLEELKPPRDPARTPLFQAMCVLQNVPRPHLALAGLAVERLPIAGTRSNFDLTLWAEEEEARGLATTLEYSTDLFDRSTAHRLLGHLRALLAAAAADADRRLSDLPLATAAEAQQILREWSASPSGGPPACVHELFAAAAAERPAGIAVVDRELAVTYAELGRRAAWVAGRLSALGAGPEDLVGLHCDRCPELLAGMLGILAAGAAYVPLDPLHPPERHEFVRADARLKAVAAPPRLAGAWRGSEVPLLPIAAPPAGFALPAPAAARAAVGPGSLAYALYTSGSTGRPKGVLVEHRSLANYSREAALRYGITAGDRVLQFAAVSFDTSAEEIYPALLSGATLVLRTDPMLASVAEFLRQCREWAVTVLNFPTSYWHEVAAALAPGTAEVPAPVRLAILGGEKALPDRLERWRRRVPPRVRLCNTYGPTEATIVATACDLPASAGGGEGTVPIGRPVAGAEVRLLDRRGRPVPPGVFAELALGGPGLARGYLRRPALTAEKFIPHPAPSEAGARLYRTGDLARFRPDGELEFLGRNDLQVKIRGYRVEPGEVEALLDGHPGVAESAVVGWTGPAGDRRLAAFIAPASAPGPTDADLVGWLKGRLPDYMLPSAFATVAALPRTPSGKLDRRALPVASLRERRAAADFVSPRTPTEEVLAGVWCQVLGLDAAGRADNFFQLGGHSLLATQVVARVRDLLGVELPLAAVFEAPDLAALAAAVDHAQRSDLPPLLPVPRDGELPLSFSQERIWFLHRLDPHLASYNVPRALRIRGPLDPAVLTRAYRALIARHEVLRTTFPSVEGRPRQVIHPAIAFRIEVVDLRALAGADAATAGWCVALGRRLFDLARGPLLRATLLRLAAEEHVLVQVEHHLVHDGWAEGVLVRDLLASYRAFAAGRPPDLPALPVQYADFAAWQRRWLQPEVLAEQLAYWRARLAGAPAVLELPTDRPRPATRTSRGAMEVGIVPRAGADALRALARRQGSTLFMVLLAGFEALLCRYTGQTDLVVGSGVANRRMRETEGLLGVLINLLVLRCDLSGDPTFAELLARVREMCLGAYAHQDLPFERLVEDLRPRRSLAYPPLFQVLFFFHDAPQEELELPGLDLEVLPSHNRSAKYDLNFIVVPRAEQLVGRRREPGGSDLRLLLEYSTDLYCATTVRRLLGHLSVLLAAAAAGDGRRLRELPLLSSPERHQLTVQWSGGQRSGGPWSGGQRSGGGAPGDLGLAHERIAAQAAATPDAVAAVAGEKATSFGSLDRRANFLAERLREEGAGLETPVALLLERTAEMAVAVLGTLKAGAAYVPLDPGYPEERLAFMLADCGAPLLLAAAAGPAGPRRALAGLDRPPRVLPVDGPGGLAGGESAAGPGAGLSPDHLAYVIYTSGSTGRPKGTLVPHRGLANYLAWCERRYPLAEGGGSVVYSSISFDLTVTALFAPLLAGRAIHLLGRDPTGAALGRALEEGPRLSFVKLTPAHLDLLRERLPASAPRGGARALIVGGEALRGEQLAFWRRRDPGVSILNEYGPTETVVGCSVFEVPAAEVASGPVPIGRPIEGACLRLLDRALEPVPAGVAGEIFIGGVGVARGYLGRPALTAERFVPDPSATGEGDRLYRTGDLGRHLADGNLDYLGRSDTQVKLRGFRIELGEIEAALVRSPAVRECAVVLRDDGTGPALVAYVVPQPGAADLGELRGRLRRELPEYMVPATFVELPALPLTVHGKVDRRALPAPGAPRRALAAPFAAPRAGTEEAVAAIWSGVLGIERVGREDSFFELGGHSLLATQVFSRVRTAFGVEPDLATLYEEPTVARMARAIEECRGRAAAAPPAPALRARARGSRSLEEALGRLSAPAGGS